MKFVKKYGYTLISEGGKYRIEKDHGNNSYYIKSEGKKLLHGNCRMSFRRQKDAKEFVENIDKNGLYGSYRWL